MGRADIQLVDGRISEAHALISLRGRGARLLSLRGRFAVDGKPLTEVELRLGLVIDIAPGVSLTVVGLTLPPRVLALRGAHGVHVLQGVTSVLPGRPPKIVYGWKPGAAVVLWPVDGDWHTADGPLESSTLEVSGHTLELEWIDNEGSNDTHRTASWSDPLTMILRFDSVHLHRERAPTVVLVGIQARVLTELALAGAPLDWYGLARSIWTDEEDRDRLRRRWDLHQYRLRRRLRSTGVREDLVRADGNGMVELVLGPDDRFLDES